MKDSVIQISVDETLVANGDTPDRSASHGTFNHFVRSYTASTREKRSLVVRFFPLSFLLHYIFIGE